MDLAGGSARCTAEPVAWLQAQPGPVRACYEAGPTGFGLYRAALDAGIDMVVIAPGKTPRKPSDRVKTDRKDAELLARLLLAGSLTAITVPAPEIEAARDLMRAHDACRRDLMTARHRVSKLLLRHGLVYPDASTWTIRHRGWLGRQHFEQPGTELAFVDALACVDAIASRKTALAERLSTLALDERWWPTVARLRCFYGIDTLTAFALHLELGGDWQRFSRAPQLAAWLGLTPTLAQSGESSRQRHHQDRLYPRSPAARRSGLALRPPARSQHRPDAPPSRTTRTRAADRAPRPPAPAPGASQDARPRQARQRLRRGLRARALLLSLGRRHRRLTRHQQPHPRRWAGAPSHRRPARAIEL